jgi:hypothetical protein
MDSIFRTNWIRSVSMNSHKVAAMTKTPPAAPVQISKLLFRVVHQKKANPRIIGTKIKRMKPKLSTIHQIMGSAPKGEDARWVWHH